MRDSGVTMTRLIGGVTMDELQKQINKLYKDLALQRQRIRELQDEVAVLKMDVGLRVAIELEKYDICDNNDTKGE